MADAIDWPAVHAEALDILQRYLRIDTSNPPGNEAPAARFLGSLLEAEGVSCEYIEIAPGREALVARLHGDGSRRPLLLGNHLDVVPVEEEFWDVPPFGGVVRDGRIYGRGAMDMKGAGVMQLMAVLLLQRRREPLRRDVVFLAAPDEEIGSTYGMRWLVEHRRDLFDAEFALNEGGGGLSDFAGREYRRIFLASVNEKSVGWLRLRVEGTTGHGSLPTEDNSALRLIRALLRLADWDRGLQFEPGTARLVDQLSRAGLLPSPEDAEAFEQALRSDPAALAMFINTLNVTVIDSGFKANVIPPRSEAVIDCRLLPGQTLEDWIEQVRARIDDPLVSVRPELDDFTSTASSDFDTELFTAIREVVEEAFEGAVVAPSVASFATDNRFLREIGVPSYGFIPCMFSAEERAGFHAHNEFLTVENLNSGCELMYEIVRRVVC